MNVNFNYLGVRDGIPVDQNSVMHKSTIDRMKIDASQWKDCNKLEKWESTYIPNSYLSAEEKHNLYWKVQNAQNK